MENWDRNKKGIKKPNKVLIETKKSLTPRGEGGNGGGWGERALTYLNR